ncbi:hypothetical protein KKH43_06580 [Patescibacteria group bacterium]|nr:hypothetical protein [Patescibacteria group bacterium]
MRVAALLFVFFGLILVLNAVIFKTLSNFSWYNKSLDSKYTEYKENAGEFDTLFFGSSRIDHQVDPELFDEEVKETSSYNLGLGAMAWPEVYYVYENVIARHSEDIDYAFIELNGESSIEGNEKTKRVLSWHTTENYIKVMQSTYFTKRHSNKKSNQIKQNTVAFIGHYVNLGMMPELISYYATKDEDDLDGSKITSNGYSSLDELFEKSKTERLAKRRDEILQNPKILEERKQNSVRAFDNDDNELINPIYLSDAERILKLSDELGIHVIFVLTPRMNEKTYNELLPVYHRIDPAHKIELADARKYPELYELENSFDVGHLNRKGSVLYTKLLAEKFNELKKEHNLP